MLFVCLFEKMEESFVVEALACLKAQPSTRHNVALRGRSFLAFLTAPQTTSTSLSHVTTLSSSVASS